MAPRSSVVLVSSRPPGKQDDRFPTGGCEAFAVASRPSFRPTNQYRARWCRTGLTVRAEIQLHPCNIRSAQLIAFLTDLRRHLRRPIVLLWDKNPTHTSRATQDFLARQRRLQVEPFPAYAPELNPDELVWTQLKRALANGAAGHLAELASRLRRALRHLRCSQPLLASCIRGSELP